MGVGGHKVGVMMSLKGVIGQQKLNSSKTLIGVHLTNKHLMHSNLIMVLQLLLHARVV